MGMIRGMIRGYDSGGMIREGPTFCLLKQLNTPKKDKPIYIYIYIHIVSATAVFATWLNGRVFTPRPPTLHPFGLIDLNSNAACVCDNTLCMSWPCFVSGVFSPRSAPNSACCPKHFFSARPLAVVFCKSRQLRIKV